MNFNYQARYKQFRNKERQFAVQAFRAGMKKEDILEIIRFDWEVFKSERVFCSHNQRIPEFGESDESMEKNNPLYQRFEEVLTSEDKYLEETIEDIILNIEDENLYKAIRKLTDDQKKLLYEIAVLMNKPIEIANDSGVSRAAVAKRMRRIKKIIKKFSLGG